MMPISVGADSVLLIEDNIRYPVFFMKEVKVGQCILGCQWGGGQLGHFTLGTFLTKGPF